MHQSQGLQAGMSGRVGRAHGPPRAKFQAKPLCTMFGFHLTRRHIQGWALPHLQLGGGVYALNRCHLSNSRFNPETVHFGGPKRAILKHLAL